MFEKNLKTMRSFCNFIEYKYGAYLKIIKRKHLIKNSAGFV